MRALRILFASLPHLCFVGTRDGFAARADLPDEDGERRHCGNECEVGEPFRQLPGLHGMHDGVHFGSGLRKADRSDARANRAKDGTLAGRKTPPAICIRNFYAAGALAANALAIACLSEIGIAGRGARLGVAEAAPEESPGDGSFAAKAWAA